jgi:hypothetical protein
MSRSCLANGRAGLFIMQRSVIPRPKVARKVV